MTWEIFDTTKGWASVGTLSGDDPDEVQKKAKEVFGCKTVALIPIEEEIMSGDRGGEDYRG